MRSIAWLSEKGGSGKTTSAINTAVCFAKKGKKTLLVDADPQGNASLVLLEGKEPTGPTLFHVLTGSADAADTIQKTATPRLHLMPADTLLAQANVSLASEVGRRAGCFSRCVAWRIATISSWSTRARNGRSSTSTFSIM